ncbi:alpha/beta hydrolase [Halopseudomonas oceani]|uniref:alpha/beta hydrolase n=1 Tax=Halopseudomonas oceani TaxID=1708783 RepID=UPI001B7FF722|nr:alpha/beta hydrolase [Halopseudomonas oceani]
MGPAQVAVSGVMIKCHFVCISIMLGLRRSCAGTKNYKNKHWRFTLPTAYWQRTALSVALSTFMLTGCLSGGGGGGGGGSSSPAQPGAATRVHDSRTFTAELPVTLPSALQGSQIYFGKYDALQGEAIYAVEVPNNWDGRGVIMWTHGYAGTGAELDVPMPSDGWREAVINAGYAWAASSYSANWYDARAGIEDTNKLALNFVDYVERDYSQRLDTPSQYLISGISMGGHIAAAAVDRENLERTLFQVPYAGAAPFCQSDQNEFQWLGDYTRLMLQIAGYDEEDYPQFRDLAGTFEPYFTIERIATAGPMVTALFNTYPGGSPNWGSPKNPDGQRLIDIARNLTGGERPVFAQGFNFIFNDVVLGTGGSDGTVNGILASNIYDNQTRVYRWTDDPTPTPEEELFNQNVPRLSADPNANPLRDDGVRWIPLVNGDFDVPVLTMHTLGDFYVPFRHQQLYLERAIDNGNDDLLVQRAIRAQSHCDFSAGEYSAAITDWLTWVNGGSKPAGDDVLDPVAIADADYGCRFTVGVRSGVPACTPPP